MSTFRTEVSWNGLTSRTIESGSARTDFWSEWENDPVKKSWAGDARREDTAWAFNVPETGWIFFPQTPAQQIQRFSQNNLEGEADRHTVFCDLFFAEPPLIPPPRHSGQSKVRNRSSKKLYEKDCARIISQDETGFSRTSWSGFHSGETGRRSSLSRVERTPPKRAAKFFAMNHLTQGFLGLLRFYKKLISPLFGPVCRFTPSCSEYMYDAVSRYGLIRGIYLGSKRILRCHPFSKGGFDPVK